MTLISNISYSREAFDDDLGTIIKYATNRLEKVNYDTMIGTGLSGALVVPTLARALDKHWAIIRKEGDGSHGSSAGFEGRIGDRWIFVDDFVVSGGTRERVIQAVTDIARREGPRQLDQYDEDPFYVGEYMYQFSGTWTPRQYPL